MYRFLLQLSITSQLSKQLYHYHHHHLVVIIIVIVIKAQTCPKLFVVDLSMACVFNIILLCIPVFTKWIFYCFPIKILCTFDSLFVCYMFIFVFVKRHV